MTVSIDERFEQVFKELKKIHRQIFWLNFFAVLKFLLIVVPIILAVIYLPPFLQPYFATIDKLVRGLSL